MCKLKYVYTYLFFASVIMTYGGYFDRLTMLKQAVPVIVGGVAFILIELYMMKSSVKRKAE